MPAEPPTRFIGRSKELLTLERLLHQERWAVIVGEGGEGKTALACELARWLLRSHRMTRAAFVCVEGFEANPTEAVLDSLGKQACRKQLQRDRPGWRGGRPAPYRACPA
ncbi:MAG: hypothetical protein QM758_06290 [Armatimonas sp.]